LREKRALEKGTPGKRKTGKGAREREKRTSGNFLQRLITHAQRPATNPQVTERKTNILKIGLRPVY